MADTEVRQTSGMSICGICLIEDWFSFRGVQRDYIPFKKNILGFRLNRYLRMRHIIGGQGCMCLIGFVGSCKQAASAKGLAFSIFRRHRGVSVGRSIGLAWKRHRFKASYLRNTLWDLGYAVDTVETAITWDRVAGTMSAVEAAVDGALARWHERVHLFSHLSDLLLRRVRVGLLTPSGGPNTWTGYKTSAIQSGHGMQLAGKWKKLNTRTCGKAYMPLQ